MKQRPFTLIELMVALGIFALVAAALSLFSSNVISSWQKLAQRRDALKEQMTLQRILDQTFTHAIPFRWRDTSEETIVEKPFIVAEPEYLRIATLHQLHDAKEGAIRFVELVLEEEDLKLNYTDRPFNTWDELDESLVHSITLASGVESIAFQYVDWSSDATDNWEERMFWCEEWETEESERTDIPLAILITIQWKDGRQFTLLRRTMGNSYRTRYGTWNPPVLNTDK